MAQSTIFPIYLRAEYRDDGKGLQAFRSDAARTAAAAKAEFAGVRTALDQALSRPRNSGGSLDLGVDELRKAAAAQQQAAVAARELAEATKRAATANGGFDASLSRATRSAFEFANAKERSSREMLQQVQALDAVQRELDQVAAATNTVTAASRRNVAVTGQQRQGMQNLSFQLNDIATQFALGASATQIFAAQSGQVIQAVQTMTGGTSRLAAFLGGPWGLAFTSAAIVATPFVAKLLEGEKSADQLREALGKVNFITNATSDAQSVLGSVLDLTTGRIKDQTAATLTLARAQLQVQLVQARLAGKQAEQTLRTAGARSVEVGTERRFTGDRTGSIAIPIRRPTVSAAAAQRALKGDGEAALAELLRLQEAGKITIDVFGKLSEATANLGASQANAKVLEDALKALGGDREALGQFLKADRGRQSSGAAEARRAAREAEQLANFGDQAAESIARLNAQFDEQPRLIDAAARATRELDAIIADLSERKPTGFEGLIAEAKRAKETVDSALVRPFEQLREESEQRLQVETLLAAGREDEAAALQQILAVERQIGKLSAERRAEIEAIVRAEAERTRYLRDQQAVFAAQLDVLGTVRRDLTDILSGRSTDFFGNFRQALQDLQGQRLFESLFGQAFRDIENELQKNTPQGRANAALADMTNKTTQTVDRLETSLDGLTDTVDRVRDRLLSDFDSEFSAANDNARGSGSIKGAQFEMVQAALRAAGVDPAGINVTGNRPTQIARTSVDDLAKRISAGVGASIGAELEDVFGPRFASAFGDIIGGAIAGKTLGGDVGGVLGGLEGLTKNIKGLGGLSDLLGKAGGGAAVGSQVAGIGKLLGIKGSTTGAQLGGAAGALTGLPGGDIVGAIIGNVVGGLLKKTPRASATIGGAGGALGIASVTGTNRELRDTANTLAASVLDSVNRIAAQLGGQVNAGAGSVSIGQRKGNLRVDTRGGGVTKIGSGAIDFGTDTEAAVAFAVRDLISDGVIAGLRQSEQNLLRAGKDVESAVRDVLDFRGVFDQLDEIRDPVGFAVRRLNREFEGMIDLFDRAGASTQEFAELEELYNLQRAAAIQDATDRIVGSLQQLLNDLRIGDSGLSLRDRQSNAAGQFSALATRVAAGDSSAFDDFAEVSQQLLDIERQLFGSTQAYFDRLNQITALTERAVQDQTNVVSIGAGTPSPFQEQASLTRAIEATGAEQVGWLKAINQNLIALAPGGPSQGSGGGGRSDGGPFPAFVANF